MASANFGKNSREWQMFGEYWALCQSLWIPEDTDTYWDKVIETTGTFARKFEDIPLAEQLVLSLATSLEEKSKGNPRNIRLKYLLREINYEINR